MSKRPFPLWFIPALIITLAAAPFAFAAIDGEPQVAAAALPVSRALENTADVQLRFVQEGGPESRHVRVELTPEDRALTPFEARSAAQQAFLETLNEPGLPDDLNRITVVVRLLPANAGASSVEQVVQFVHKGGKAWSILAGE